MSRRTRTQLPTSMVLLKPDLVAENVKANLEAKRKKSKTHYDKRALATELPPLQVGQQVLVKTAAKGEPWKTGVITATPVNRSYEVTAGAQITRRNRRHIKLAPVSRGCAEDAGVHRSSIGEFASASPACVTSTTVEQPINTAVNSSGDNTQVMPSKVAPFVQVSPADSNTIVSPLMSSPSQEQVIRRSARVSKKPDYYVPQ